jgi:predicted nucleic acid-binding Zn ribbon protein
MIEGIEAEFRKDIREKKKSLPRGGVVKNKPRGIITPYDINPNRPEYKPGKVHIFYFPKCKVCGKPFIKKDPRQIYCGPKCREKIRMRKKRERRVAKGICSHCGKPMTGNLKPRVIYSRRPPKYCRECLIYWQSRYKRKKAKIK